MTKKLIALAAASILASACGGSAEPAKSADDVSAQSAEDAAEATPDEATPDQASPEEPQAEEPAVEPTSKRIRKVGDYVVHRYTGEFRQTPLMVTEEVIAEEGDLFVIEYTFEETGFSTRLRTRTDHGGNVVSVFKLDGEREVPMPMAAFDALIAETTFAPDVNEKLLGSESSVCLVGVEEMDCEKHKYQVIIGDKTATLTVSSSAKVPGGDLDGEITTEDGKLIYRAQLVEMGNDASSESSVASAKWTPTTLFP